MTTKHTPGIWIAHGEQVSCRPEPETRFIIANAFAPLALGSREYTTQAQANARLIAAAPEMYECLQEAVKCIAWCRKHHSDPQSGTGFPAEVRWIAALAKAEGRET